MAGFQNGKLDAIQDKGDVLSAGSTEDYGYKEDVNGTSFPRARNRINVKVAR